MIDKDLLTFYNEVIDGEKERKIVEMLETGIDNEEILEYILGEGEKND